MNTPDQTALDFQTLFESVPGLYTAVQPTDEYRIVAVSAAFLRATMTRREDLVGRSLFEAFPGNPADPAATGMAKMRAALERVRQTRAPEKVSVLPDDLRRTELVGDGFEQRHRWTLLSPVFAADGALRFIVCQMEGVTAQDATGKLRPFPGAVVDITERTRAEEALRESEERLRMAIESANLGTWDFNPVTGELIWSDQCRAMFGLPPGAEVNYEVFLAGVHPEDRERIDTVAQAALRLENDGVFQVDYRTVGLQDGIDRWVAARGRAFLDASGQVRRFIGTVLDITERKRAEEAAARSSAQLQELTAISTRLNAAHDVRSVLGILTEEARRLIGAHQAVTTVTLDRHKAEPITIVSQANKGSPPKVSAEPLAAGSRPPPNDCLTVPLVGRNTRNFGIIQLSDKSADQLSDDDLALLAQLSHVAGGAIENARLYEELREKDRRKDEFLAMLAHELRNPLAAIRNAVALTSGVTDAEESGWIMDVIHRQLRQLTRLIDDLFDVSRITRGKIQLRKELIDAAPILRNAVEAVQPLVEERQHELTVSFRPGTLYLEADPTRLEQIVVNLLTNAAKYTEAGGQISLRAKNEGREIVIRVQDNGAGISPEKLPQMFELFVQGDRTLARSEGGLGIGLTLVRTLAEMHEGSVQAYSEGLGKGSEFIVRLPASASRVAPGSALAGGRIPLPRAALVGAPSANSGPRVLVVDDNMDSAHTLARLLSREGYDVRTVYDGPTAVDVARAYRPEFVLLDIGLPGMDGYQVAARLRQEADLKNTVLIALSGYGQETDRNRSREAGFDQHLVKPVEHDFLLTLLARPAAPASAPPPEQETQ